MPKNVNFNFNMSIVGIIAIILIIAGAVIMFQSKPGNGTSNPPASSEPSKYDNFAKCLSDKGAKMYGAYWCGHCKNQKEAFGASFQYINYQECAKEGDNSYFAQACKDAGVKGYPTWKFSDGTVKEGEVALSELGKITGCALPQ